MSQARKPPTIALVVMGVAWLAFAAFDFHDAGERGGLTLSNARVIRALVALALGIGAFLASRYTRRPS